MTEMQILVTINYCESLTNRLPSTPPSPPLPAIRHAQCMDYIVGNYEPRPRAYATNYTWSQSKIVISN